MDDDSLVREFAKLKYVLDLKNKSYNTIANKNNSR